MFSEDLTAFFNADELATNATLDGAPVCGIFDAAYVAVDSGASLGVDSTNPQFVLPTSQADAAGVHHGSALVVNAVTYRVISIEPDGTGVTTLRLQF